MSVGPIEIVVLAFPGSRFTGDIRPRIEDAIRAGIVRIVDAVLATKSVDGEVTFAELEDLVDDPEALHLAQDLGEHVDLLSADDIAELAAELDPGSSALALAFEHAWMLPIRDAVVASGGILLADVHVPGAAVEEVLAALQDA